MLASLVVERLLGLHHSVQHWLLSSHQPQPSISEWATQRWWAALCKTAEIASSAAVLVIPACLWDGAYGIVAQGRVAFHQCGSHMSCLCFCRPAQYVIHLQAKLIDFIHVNHRVPLGRVHAATPQAMRATAPFSGSSEATAVSGPSDTCQGVRET